MAEFVESRMEEMVSIWEKVRQTNLLQEPKLKKIIGDIREHELKIQRPARTLDDYFAYFKYLKEVLDLLKGEREIINYFHHTIEIEDRLKAIIASRFGMANHNFKHDLNFWIFRLKFMNEMNWREHVSNLFTEVTKVLGSKYPQLWIDASNFEWAKKPESCSGIQTARQFVQLGLRRFPDLLNLYIQGFTLELRYVNFLLNKPTEKEKVFNELENAKRIVEDLVLAKSFYIEAKKTCNKEGVKLYENFYSVARLFPSTTGLCKEILDDMRSQCFSDERTYDTLAKIALAKGNGRLYQSDVDDCIQCYEEGLTIRPTSTMYDLYITTLTSLASQISGSKSDLDNKLLKIFEKAYERWKLSEQGYVKWYKFVKSIEESGERVTVSSNYSSSDILAIAHDKFPQNADILRDKISQELLNEKTSSKVAILQKYHKELVGAQQTDALETIWSSIFISLTLQPKVSTEQCENFILRAPRLVRRKLSILFIKYFSCIDMNSARAYYDKSFANPSNSLDFHLEMGRLELATLHDKQNRQIILDRISQCYENATEYFGKNNIEPWLAYIRFEKDQRHDAKKSSVIYARALTQLPPDLKEEFILAEKQTVR